jgi:hypothetical protein
MWYLPVHLYRFGKGVYKAAILGEAEEGERLMIKGAVGAARSIVLGSLFGVDSPDIDLPDFPDSGDVDDEQY